MDSIVNLTKKFFAMIEILNQLILPKFVNNTSFKNYTVLYTGTHWYRRTQMCINANGRHTTFIIK
jgi:hypothetical protein